MSRKGPAAPPEPSDPVPDALLAPLVECSGEVLRAMPADEVPVALRHLLGFDRRGLGRSVALRQVRRALEGEESFREQVGLRFTARPAIAALLERWSPTGAVALAAEAAARDDLPLLASALWAARPEGWELGLGAVLGVEAVRRDDRDRSELERTHRRERESLEEAVRRTETALAEVRGEVERLETELREERRSRRHREGEARAATEAAERRVARLEAELDRQREAAAGAEARAEREAVRARELDVALRAARARVVEPVSGPGRGRLAPVDERALARAVDEARRLTASLDALAERLDARQSAGAAASAATSTASSAPTGPAVRPEPAPGRRARPALPGGLVADSRAGLDAMLRGPAVCLIVDGYNVTKRQWGDAPAADQRERLAMALADLHARTGCAAVAVFDGDGTTAPPALRRAGLRVVFSDAGEEADEVVVREAAGFPKRVPLVVASSDAWVREHAEAEGAVVVSADTLLAVLR